MFVYIVYNLVMLLFFFFILLPFIVNKRFSKRTRNSAIADKPHNMFIGQSKSPNLVPFRMLGMVSY